MQFKNHIVNKEASIKETETAEDYYPLAIKELLK